MSRSPPNNEPMPVTTEPTDADAAAAESEALSAGFLLKKTADLASHLAPQKSDSPRPLTKWVSAVKAESHQLVAVDGTARPSDNTVVLNRSAEEIAKQWVDKATGRVAASSSFNKLGLGKEMVQEQAHRSSMK